MRFRTATATDVALLAQLNRQLIEDEGHRNPMTLPELEDRMRHWLQTEYQAIIFEQSSTPVAYALYRRAGDAIYLRQFFVLRQRRRQGFGRQAMDLLFSQVWAPPQRVIVEVLATNRRGAEFWKVVGFQEYAVTLERMPGE